MKRESKGFRCAHCHQMIQPATSETAGTQHRDHCSHCLYSIHVDKKPGDRSSVCYGLMKPIGITFKNRGGEPMIVYRCDKCARIHKNRCAGDDSEIAIINVLRDSLAINNVNPGFENNSDIEEARHILLETGIRLVDRGTTGILLESIFGRGHIPDEYKKEFNISDLQ